MLFTSKTLVTLEFDKIIEMLADCAQTEGAKARARSLLPSDVFVIGNEGHGLSQDVIEACDGCVIIPMREGCESLNAAMAAGILMWETVRYRA